MDENSYGMLTVWAAGPSRSFRVQAKPDDYRPSKVTTRDDSGNITVRSESRTQRDQEMIDETINEFLAEAQVPPVLSGFHWFVKVPPHVSRQQLTDHISAANEYLDAPSVKRRIAELYEDLQPSP
ncbi:hypothetical protein J2W54_002905 [Rhodococcus fascians]|nr:hypothetical protein ASH04_23520 [Rhodococcus sp. Leaf233]MDR6910952.1 hypothetical protein [Rhodococcus sp. 3258]MDR6932511.1 hypothetical protein [Rhodococcus fascians]